jgi:hypothetical protein
MVDSVLRTKDQHEYDIARDADEDAMEADHEKHSRKPNDITHSENRQDSRKQISSSALGRIKNLNYPGPLHRFIGSNEYLLITQKQFDELPESAQEEVKRIHSKHVYKHPENHDEYFAIPNQTINTPQPFAGEAGALSKRNHDDVFAENVKLEEDRIKAKHHKE